MIELSRWLTRALVFGAMVNSGLFAACSGDKSESVDGIGGTGNTGGQVAVGGQGQGGSGRVNCGASEAIPENGRITDFTEVADGIYAGQNFSFGDSVSLSGGTFFYQPEGNTSLTATVTAGSLNLSGTIPASDYAGFGFWFRPSCSNASAFTGISLTFSGTAGNSEIQFQVQSSRNYPIDSENSKGECTGTWTDGCSNNRVVLQGYGQTAATIEVPFTALVDGLPISPLDPSELLGIQWEFRCGDAADCTPNVTLDDIKFY